MAEHLRANPRGRRLDAEEIAALFLTLDLNALLEGTAKEAKLGRAARNCPVQRKRGIGVAQTLSSGCSL